MKRQAYGSAVFFAVFLMLYQGETRRDYSRRAGILSLQPLSPKHFGRLSIRWSSRQLG